MKKIKLTKGKFALVDDSDFEWINQWHWYLSDKGYAIREFKGKPINMHRLINNTPKGLETDHINRNRIDNRRENLRTVTKSQNATFLRSIGKNNTSGRIGVYWRKERKKWRVQISINKKYIYLGHFNDIKEAMTVRKNAERIYYA